MGRISIDDPSFSEGGEPLPLALAEPVERGAPAAGAPEDDEFYVVETDPYGGMDGGPLRTVMRYWHGRFYSTSEEAYDDDPPLFEGSGDTVICKINLWPDQKSTGGEAGK